MQKILVTGAGNGIGREIALAFARSGARIAGLDVDEAALQLLRAGISSFVAEPCDLGAVFLASDAARSISGQSLPVDGDMHRSV